MFETSLPQKGEDSIFIKMNAHARLFYLLQPRIWVPRDQNQPGSLGRGNSLGIRSRREESSSWSSTSEFQVGEGSI